MCSKGIRPRRDLWGSALCLKWKKISTLLAAPVCIKRGQVRNKAQQMFRHCMAYTQWDGNCIQTVGRLRGEYWQISIARREFLSKKETHGSWNLPSSWCPICEMSYSVHHKCNLALLHNSNNSLYRIFALLNLFFMNHLGVSFKISWSWE